MTSDLRTLPWLTNLNIPAEIQDFWLRAGKKIGGTGAASVHFIYHCSDDEYYSQGGPPPALREDILARGDKEVMMYYIDKKWYNQEEMLKLIKLKAFL